MCVFIIHDMQSLNMILEFYIIWNILIKFKAKHLVAANCYSLSQLAKCVLYRDQQAYDEMFTMSSLVDEGVTFFKLPYFNVINMLFI